MAKYKLTFKKSVTKDFRSIPKKDIQKILQRIESLANEPRAEGCVKLSGQENYRVRQDLYRIVYEIRDKVLLINIIKVSHRSSFYKSK